MHCKDELPELVVPLIATLASGYLGWKKYDYNNPSKDLASFIKKSANTHADAALMISTACYANDSLAYDELRAAGTVLGYLGKYALFNQPSKE